MYCLVILFDMAMGAGLPIINQLKPNLTSGIVIDRYHSLAVKFYPTASDNLFEKAIISLGTLNVKSPYNSVTLSLCQNKDELPVWNDCIESSTFNLPNRDVYELEWISRDVPRLPQDSYWLMVTGNGRNQGSGFTWFDADYTNPKVYNLTTAYWNRDHYDLKNSNYGPSLFLTLQLF
ncbi:hypothetical protein BC833DRAFT_601342 [Globomyces pollinis-pini]|nr:hypothetical protein BC833DRAFT_601342 [Globomyces pollinis-pini]